jgi:hypothetical protein
VPRQREQEREAALQHKPRYVTYRDFLDDVRRHIDDPVRAGTGLTSSFVVDEDPRMIRATGMHEKLFP